MNIKKPEDLLENGSFKAGILSALKSYLFTQTVVEQMRPSHDEVSAAAMAKFKPVVEDRDYYRNSKRLKSDIGEFIESYEGLYQASDAACEEIYSYYAQEMAKRGYEAEKGFCPWLVACNTHMKAEGVLIGVMEAYTGVSNVNLHIKGKREQYIKLVTGLLVKLATERKIELNIINETMKETA